ncbi:MAG TPA: CPBP family glutamic-type intramembrane protease [Spirochaetia bacterium]|nr:CPBP family glutamic-type intramembrane protease [Spirochaetia bacterium]
MADLVILSLGLFIHMWALPYSFKNLFLDTVVRVAQVAFAVTILARVQPAALAPTGSALLTGAGVGAACLLFHVFWNWGALLPREKLTRPFLASQALLLLFHAPSEELFYKGVFFTVLVSIWGPLTAIVIATALSAMVAVVSSRRTGLWLESAFVGALGCLGYYWSQCVWTPVLIRALNDVGFVTLTEQRNLFGS